MGQPKFHARKQQSVTSPRLEHLESRTLLSADFGLLISDQSSDKPEVILSNQLSVPPRALEVLVVDQQAPESYARQEMLQRLIGPAENQNVLFPAARAINPTVRLNVGLTTTVKDAVQDHIHETLRSQLGQDHFLSTVVARIERTSQVIEFDSSSTLNSTEGVPIARSIPFTLLPVDVHAAASIEPLPSRQSTEILQEPILQWRPDNPAGVDQFNSVVQIIQPAAESIRRDLAGGGRIQEVQEDAGPLLVGLPVVGNLFEEEWANPDPGPDSAMPESQPPSTDLADSDSARSEPADHTQNALAAGVFIVSFSNPLSRLLPVRERAESASFSTNSKAKKRKERERRRRDDEFYFEEDSVVAAFEKPYREFAEAIAWHTEFAEPEVYGEALEEWLRTGKEASEENSQNCSLLPSLFSPTALLVTASLSAAALCSIAKRKQAEAKRTLLQQESTATVMLPQ